MFKSADGQSKTIAAAVELSSGERLVGNIIARHTVQNLADQLNKPDPFIEFETLDGEVVFIGKTTVASVHPMDIPKGDELSRRQAATNFDPHRTLGVQPSSPHDEIRSAYLALAMKYHPDRYARVDLPREVQEYLSSTLSRINTAYQMLGGKKEDAA